MGAGERQDEARKLNGRRQRLVQSSPRLERGSYDTRTHQRLASSNTAWGRSNFPARNDALYERHLTFDNVVDVKKATVREQFEAAAHAIRDIVSQRWLLTEETYAEKNPKRVYYLSMEFLLGRSLANNIMNALLQPLAQEAVQKKGLDPLAVYEWSRMPDWATAALEGWQPASLIRWQRWRFQAWDMACAMSTGSSSRPSWMVGNVSSRIIGCDVRIPGR